MNYSQKMLESLVRGFCQAADNLVAGFDTTEEVLTSTQRRAVIEACRNVLATTQESK